MPLSNSALASGEACALSASAKSRVPESITSPGRNLRVAGLGVCSVRISISAMWPSAPFRSRTEGRRSSNHPADGADSNAKANQRDPPFSGPHRLAPGVEDGSAGDHRLGQVPAPHSVEDDRRDVEDDEAEDDVEPQLVDVPRLVRRVGADQPIERTGVDAVLVLRDEAERNLDSNSQEQCEHTDRAERRVAAARPATAKKIEHGARCADEARPARG